MGNGRFCLSQTIPKHGQRLYQLVDWSGETKTLAKKVAKAEEAIYADKENSLVNWDEMDVQTGLEAVGLSTHTMQQSREKGQRQLTTAHLERWFGGEENGTYGRRLLEGGLNEKEVAKVHSLYKKQLEGTSCGVGNGRALSHRFPLTKHILSNSQQISCSHNTQ